MLLGWNYRERRKTFSERGEGTREQGAKLSPSGADSGTIEGATITSIFVLLVLYYYYY